MNKLSQANIAKRKAQSDAAHNKWLKALKLKGTARTGSKFRVDLATANGFTARPDGKAYVITRKAA